MLAEHGCRVTVVPATASAEDILRHHPDGIFLSNGPGDPAATGDYAVPVLRELIAAQKPIFGICLGHQMLALALGGRTRKMDKGHRGANHPVQRRSHRQGRDHQPEPRLRDRSREPAGGRRPDAYLLVRPHATRVCASMARRCSRCSTTPKPAPARRTAITCSSAFVDAMAGGMRGGVSMPKRTDIKSILIIGAGPIVIGQACEFDYSGAQACKALKAEGYRIVLVNSNPATIMTDPELADATYIEPITPGIVEQIIARERATGHPIDALLPTMGGQTALNTAMALAQVGRAGSATGCELIGANEEAIAKAEDRQLFRQAMDRIGLESPKSRLVGSLEAALEALDAIGLPAIIRPSFTWAAPAAASPTTPRNSRRSSAAACAPRRADEVLIEESVLGWKEFELEVVRDRADNCIIICSIENIDPMGVHTGDSVTVAPALTLTDKEYQIMRNAAIAVLREIGVDTGGSNVQFAVNPADGRLVIIEMNPRVSRSSALASKATGFPIAKVAAKLAVGYTLDELDNEITGVTPASFEPTIDYIVTKMPRFTFEKFPGAEPLLTTSMKSVGEAMAIGRSFAESVQKALRSMDTGLDGFDEVAVEGIESAGKEAVRAALTRPTPDRLLLIAQAYRHGLSTGEIHAACRYDPWFLERIREIVAAEEGVRQRGLPEDPTGLLRLKQMGFSDARLAKLATLTEAQVAERRRCLGLSPGLQADRHLRRRVRLADPVYVLVLRGRRDRAARMRG